jgi:hypothetical protein
MRSLQLASHEGITFLRTPVNNRVHVEVGGFGSRHSQSPVASRTVFGAVDR